MDYRGPDRRTIITFTREDSDRMVRMEQQLITNNDKIDEMITHVKTQNVRISRLERWKSWATGIGSTVVFLITCALAFVGIHKH